MSAAAPASLALLAGLAAGGAVLLALALIAQAPVARRVVPLRALAIALVLAGALAALAVLALGMAPARLALPFLLGGVRPLLALDAIAAFFLVALLPVAAVALALTATPARMTALVGSAMLALLAGEAATLALGVAAVAIAGAGLLRPRAGRWPLAWVGFIAVPALVVALAIPAGDGRFAALRANPPEGWAAAAMLGLGLLGGLVLAGLHTGFARPTAVPANALAAAVPGQLGLYVLVRVLADLAGPGPAWWGVPLVLAGGVMALHAALRAARASTVRGVLAGMATAQAGLVVLGLGMALAARGVDDGPATGLALGGALFGVLAYGWVQALWAAAAGAIEDGGGSQHLARLGGLLGRMRFSAVGALVAAFAVAAVPPGAGFMAAWLLMQAAVTLPRGGGADWWLLGLAAAGALALAGAVLGFAMLRRVGVVLLGRPRSPRAAAAEEVAPRHRWLILALSALVLAIGLAPAAVLALARPAVRLLGGGAVALDGLSPLLLAALIGLAAVALAVLIRAHASRYGAAAEHRVAPAWEDGRGPAPAWMPFGDPTTQLGAAGFARMLGIAPTPGVRAPTLRAPTLHATALRSMASRLATHLIALPRRSGPALAGGLLLALLALHLAGAW